MSVKMGGALVALLVVGIGIVGLWYQNRHGRVIVGTGSLRVESRTRPGDVQVLRTRTVAVGRVRLEEIELPRGTWIDCAGDCARAAREAGPDFWDAQARDRGR